MDKLFEDDERSFFELIYWNNYIKKIKNYLCNISPEYRTIYRSPNFDPDSVYCVF